MKLKDLLPKTKNSGISSIAGVSRVTYQNQTTTQEPNSSTIFAIGEIDGNILQAYSNIQSKEQELGVVASWVICPGSFGIWPDYKYVDSATRKNGDVGDFHELYHKRWSAPRNTLFVSGAHEDHYWLQRRWKSRDTQVLGRVWYLNNGYETVIGPSVVGLGKVFSPKVYAGEKHPKQIKYYTRREVERACSVGPTDILLSHQGPKDTIFGRKQSNSEGIKHIMYATRPKLMIHSGYGFSKRYECLGIQCVSLNKLEVVAFKWTKDQGIDFLT